MRIVLASPLYPPDIAEPAPYIKELARRLASSHAVTVVTYGRFPEKVDGVRIIAVDKRQPLVLRLIAYTFALFKAAQSADIVYAENGSSVELPAGLVARLCAKPLIFHRGDLAAREHSSRNSLRKHLERFAREAAASVVDDSPRAKPEILPFAPLVPGERAAYETSWKTHVSSLERLLRHD